MIFGSVCSGIEAASVAWCPLGWRAAFYSEIEPFPCAVLNERHPGVPNWGDMTKFKEWPDAAIDVLVGGTPCQSFSVAGLRKGLADPRGNLMLTYLAIADKYRPAWLVWENVPGVLSSNGGRDFASFLRGLAELRYGFAYRILDAQFFGVPQRRRRVFVVGYLGDWRRAAAVLFERHSLSGDSAPRRETGQSPSGSIRASAAQRGGIQEQDGGSGLIPEIARTIATREGTSQDWETTTMVAEVTHSLRADGFDASEDGTGRGTPLVPVAHVETLPTLRAAASQEWPGHGARPGDTKDEYIVPVMTLAIRGRGDSHNLEYRTDGTANAILTPNGGRAGIGVGAIAAPITASYGKQLDSSDTSKGPPNLIQAAMQVRRLTPRECERLQGFPDDYTLITVRGKPAADGPRYKALGNSMAVPVMNWMGRRIDMLTTGRAG